MLKPKSFWIVIPGTLVLISGMTGCRSAGQNHSAASSMIGQPSSQYAEGARRGSGSDRGLEGKSYDSNGYLQPVPAPPVDDESAGVSRPKRGDATARKPRLVDLRTVKVGHETVSDAPSSEPVEAVQGEPVEAQKKLLPEPNGNGIFKKLGDGFSDFMASLSGTGPRNKTSQVGKRTRMQEKRLAARSDEKQYIPFEAVQSEPTSIVEDEVSETIVPATTTRMVDRNPVELGLPEAF